VLMPVHAVSLVAMGLWLLDNCDLEACATTAAEFGQWDFQLAVAPVRLAGTSGSPVKPDRHILTGPPPVFRRRSPALCGVTGTPTLSR